jgi:hypothetical protein
MTNRIRGGRAVSRFRFGVCLGLAAATLAGIFAGPVRADDRDHWRRDRQEWRGDHHEWREGYYRRPDVYYSAPPVIYPPHGYYQQPGATFSFSFPFR